MEQPASGAELAGKTAVVTGATSGIGEETALGLAQGGARVIVVARSAERAAATLAKLPAPATGAHASVIADLSVIAEMKRAAAGVAALAPVIDILVNNAGGEFNDRQVTLDGLERTFALNHLSYFVVTLLLLDRVKAAPQGRILNTSSRMHGAYRMDFSDLQGERKYDGYAAYGRSKLSNILFTRALARRLAGTTVTVNALHPGFVATRFGDDDRSPMGVIFRWAKAFALSPEAGARTTLHVATSKEGGRITGGYFVKSAPARPSRAAESDEDAERLWEISAQLTGVDAPAG